eukprot:583394-Amorphochlora_amoeboformis.AAC.2
MAVKRGGDVAGFLTRVGTVVTGSNSTDFAQFGPNCRMSRRMQHVAPVAACCSPSPETVKWLRAHTAGKGSSKRCSTRGLSFRQPGCGPKSSSLRKMLLIFLLSIPH